MQILSNDKRNTNIDNLIYQHNTTKTIVAAMNCNEYFVVLYFGYTPSDHKLHTALIGKNLFDRIDIDISDGNWFVYNGRLSIQNVTRIESY